MRLKQNLRKFLVLLVMAGLIIGYQFTRLSFVSCFVDDAILHMSWSSQFQQSVREGNLVPRWLPLANGGYGSPVFIFYSPLVYYVTALLGFVFPSVATAMKFVKLLGLFLSGMSMYLFSKLTLGQKGGLAAALFYMLLPYHVLDNYYWTFYAETWAWAWFPLILYCLQRCLDSPDNVKAFIGFSFSFAGLILTHLVSAYMFCFVVAAFAVWNGWRVWRTWILKVSLAVLASFLLASFYFFPMIYERQFVHIDRIVKLVDYRNTFVFFPNEVAHRYYRFFLNIIILLQWVVGFQLLFSLSSYWCSRGMGRRTSSTYHSYFFLMLLGVCLLFTTRLSVWFWGVIPGLSQVQFPMRWLAFMTLASAYLGGRAFMDSIPLDPSTRLSRMKSLALVASLFLCLLLSLVIILKSCFLEDRANRLALQHAYNATEYNPVWTSNPEKRLVFEEAPRFSLLAGKAEIAVTQWNAHRRVLEYHSDEPLILRLRLFYYPGWTAYLNGSRWKSRMDSSGAIVLDLPQGQNEVVVAFEDTVWRRAAGRVSIVSFLALGFIFLFPRRKINSKHLISLS